MKKLQLLTLFSLISISGFANIYGVGYGTTIINTLDGGYAVLALDTPTSYFSLDAYLMKLDSMGNIQWLQTDSAIDAMYDREYHRVPLTQLSDSGYAYSLFSGYNSLHLFRTDKSGNLGFDVNYDPEDASIFNSIVEDQAGNLVMGVTTNGLTIENPCGFLYCNPNGSIQNFAQVNYSGACQAMIETNLGNYVALCDSDGVIADNALNISCADNSGNILWNTMVYDPLKYYHGYSICAADSGVFISAKWITNPQTVYSRYLAKVDYNGNLLWSRHESDPNAFLVIKPFRDGFVGLDFQGRFYRCNTFGDTLWSKQIWQGALNFNTTNSGGFIFTGDSIGQIWVSITDSSGNILRMGTTGIQSAGKFNNIRIFPNPCSTSTTIILPESIEKNFRVELYDMKGILVKSFSPVETDYKESTITLPLSGLGLSTGEYQLRISDRQHLYRSSLMLK